MKRKPCPKCHGSGYHKRKCHDTNLIQVCSCRAGKAWKKKWGKEQKGNT